MYVKTVGPPHCDVDIILGEILKISLYPIINYFKNFV